jgi:hypothetical protein
VNLQTENPLFPGADQGGRTQRVNRGVRLRPEQRVTTRCPLTGNTRLQVRPYGAGQGEEDAAEECSGCLHGSHLKCTARAAGERQGRRAGLHHALARAPSAVTDAPRSRGGPPAVRAPMDGYARRELEGRRRIQSAGLAGRNLRRRGPRWIRVSRAEMDGGALSQWRNRGRGCRSSLLLRGDRVDSVWVTVLHPSAPDAPAAGPLSLCPHVPATACTVARR